MEEKAKFTIILKRTVCYFVYLFTSAVTRMISTFHGSVILTLLTLLCL